MCRKFLAFAVAILSVGETIQAGEVPWPAESMNMAVNLTPIEGAGVNDFYLDLSGAFWNPVTRRLWVCRNGPGGLLSKMWAIRENGQGGYQCDYQKGIRGEWTGFGDLEDICQADLNEQTVYAIVEGEELIKEYDVSNYGIAVLRNVWNTASYLPLVLTEGSEGITFVPDANLASGGFVDPKGVPRISANGMGGLMFVATQIGGDIYVFDLNRSDSSFSFVGAYKTSYSESAGLAFDRQSGLLYILHGANQNRIEVVSLASIPVGNERQFKEKVTYAPPAGGSGMNIEGIALVPDADCSGNNRSFFLTIDDGGAQSFFQFKHFPCHVSADLDGNGVVNGRDIKNLINTIMIGPIHGRDFITGDMNMDGFVNFDDVQPFVDRLVRP